MWNHVLGAAMTSYKRNEWSWFYVGGNRIMMFFAYLSVFSASINYLRDIISDNQCFICRLFIDVIRTSMLSSYCLSYSSIPTLHNIEIYIYLKVNNTHPSGSESLFLLSLCLHNWAINGCEQSSSHFSMISSLIMHQTDLCTFRYYPTLPGIGKLVHCDSFQDSTSLYLFLTTSHVTDCCWSKIQSHYNLLFS